MSDGGSEQVATFLRARGPELVRRWQAGAAPLARAKHLSDGALVDHVPAIVAAIADAIDPRCADAAPLAKELAAHALARVAEGFELTESLAELSLLRQTLLSAWNEERPGGAPAAARTLDAALDAVVGETARLHFDQRNRTAVALDRISSCALASPTLPSLLDALLEAVLAGCPAVEGAAFLLLDGDRLRIASVRGIDPAPDVSLAVGEGVVGEVAATRRPISTSGSDPRIRDPSLRHQRAVTGVPLLFGGDLLGVALATSSRTDRFDATDRQLLTAMAERAAAGIRIHALHDAMRASEAAARKSEEQLRFLAEAGKLLSGSLDVSRTAQQLADLAVPRIADWCLLDLLDPNGAIVTAAVATADPDPVRLDRIRAYRARRPPSMQQPYGTTTVILTGAPLLLREVTPEALRSVAPDEEYVQWVLDAGLRSILAVPLRGHRGVLGAFALGTARSTRLLGEEELRLAEALAARASLAIDNARLYEEARRAVRLREDVLAVVSHDLRTPLHAIRLTAQVLERRAQDDRALRNTQSIGRAAERAISLLRDLLDMASIQAGRLSVQPVLAQATTLADEAAELHAGAASERGIALAREGQAGSVTADPERVVQVLGNLLGNALKFSPRDSRVVLRVREVEGGVRFEVEDAGPGVRTEELARMCDAWWTEGRGAGGERGTGLGLFIARGILQAHRSTLEVEPAPEGGARFHFTLPRA